MTDQPLTGVAVATDNLLIRRRAMKEDPPLGMVAKWERIEIVPGSETNGYVQLANNKGWVAFAYLKYATSIRPMFVVGTDELRRRAGPGTGYGKLGVVKRGETVPVLIGSETNRFVKLADRAGWVSMNYLSRTPGTEPIPPTPTPVPLPTTNGRIWGININPYGFGISAPPEKLRGVSFARFVFMVAAAPLPQNRTLDAAFAFYDPIIRALANQGTRVLLVINQESVTDKIPWGNNGQTWAGYTPGFAAFLRRVAQHYGSDVFAYEIWNEQDISAETSVYIPPADYGQLLRASIVAVNGLAKVVSGGLAGSNPVGYLKQCGSLAGLNGIGVHPYGQTVNPIPSLPNFGSITTYLNTVRAAFPGVPLWITEYGIARVDVTNRALWPRIAQYMRETFSVLKKRSDVAAAIWFAWSDPMDNAGIVTADQKPKGDIYDQFMANVAIDIKAAAPAPTPPPVPTTPPPPAPAPTPPPVPGKCKIGLHIASYADSVKMISMAQRLKAAGKPLAVATVLDDPQLANELAAYTTVMFRPVWVPELYHSGILDDKTPDQAEALGRAFYFGQHHKPNSEAHAAQFLKLRNETGFHSLDCWFDIGIMKAAESEGRRVAICGDSMSSVTPEQWAVRLPALRYAKAHGHAVTLNAYGPVVNGQAAGIPVSADDGFIWFGGWPFRLYESVPDAARPLLIIGETGTSDSSVFRGADFVVNDMREYNRKIRQYDYLIGFAYWTAGTWIGHNASLDPALPQIEALILSS